MFNEKCILPLQLKPVLIGVFKKVFDVKTLNKIIKKYLLIFFIKTSTSGSIAFSREYILTKYSRQTNVLLLMQIVVKLCITH